MDSYTFKGNGDKTFQVDRDTDCDGAYFSASRACGDFEHISAAGLEILRLAEENAAFRSRVGELEVLLAHEIASNGNILGQQQVAAARYVAAEEEARQLRASLGVLARNLWKEARGVPVLTLDDIAALLEEAGLIDRCKRLTALGADLIPEDGGPPRLTGEEG